jgi:ABC-type sugar transport system ATPase subunit
MYMKTLNIKAPSIFTFARQLSGGNQRKLSPRNGWEHTLRYLFSMSQPEVLILMANERSTG